MVPINCLPLDVLCIIPTYLASLNDRLRVTFVCCHWRRTFLQHATLWSQLHLSGRTDRLLVKTLLERTKGSSLDITADHFTSSIHDVTLFSPFAQQIRSLKLSGIPLDQVQDLSIAISGPLSLLRTLEISTRRCIGGPDSLVTSTHPLFESAVNLEGFTLRIFEFPSLRHFTFPNLTTFSFSIMYTRRFPVSELLDFLEASPVLQWINVSIDADQFHEDVPLERVVILPYVKTFSLCIVNYGPGCEIAAHILCPFAKRVEFSHMLGCAGNNVPKAIYPPSAVWNTIIHQYTRGTVEQVALEMTMDEDLTIDCWITFRSSDGATLKLCYTHHAIVMDQLSLQK